MKKRFTLFTLACLSFTIMAAPPAQSKALFYETFDEHDFRKAGILPQDVERIRISGRLFGTEMEIEAPSGGEDTVPLAQFIPDPTGLSLVVLKLQDNGTEIGTGDFSADGGVSLLESIILDQGDYSGKAVAAWTAIPYQTNEPGGAMFPETDTAIDPGPEGLNLIGFGGVTRDFDTGQPIPGQDFSGEITMNMEGSATISPLGVQYQPMLPYFFVLDFDLETSLYDIYINGLLVKENVPFFDIEGETGKTLRELELISSARGLGTFAYDNLFQIDPDRPYEPVPFRTPLIADDAPVIPFFMEDFDDNPLGRISLGFGDLVGSYIQASENVEVVRDTSYQTLARASLNTGDSIYIHHTPSKNTMDPLRYSFTVVPQAGSDLEFKIDNHSILSMQAGDVLSLDTNGDGTLEASSIQILSNIPHWVSLTLNPQDGTYEVNVYRANSATDASTAHLEATGLLSDLDIPISAAWIAQSGSLYLDNLLGVRLNETPDGDSENRYLALLQESFDDEDLGSHAHYPGIVVNDPSGWSFRSLQTSTDQRVNLLNGVNLHRSVRLYWSAIPQQTNVRAGVLTLQFMDANGDIDEREIAGFLNNAAIGWQNDQDELEGQTVPGYTANEKYSFNLTLDLLNGNSSLEVRSRNSIGSRKAFPNSESMTLVGAYLQGNAGGTIIYDDFLVVKDPYGAIFEPAVYEPPVSVVGTTLLFEENFENNPARSEQQINEFNARKSGLPIETSSKGFSDLAETDLQNSTLTVGAPSAEAAYVIDPDGSSLYSLLVADNYAPADFSGFQRAVQVNPISTLRTVPYSMVVPQLVQAPSSRYVTIRWSANAQQSDQVGLALFLGTQDVTIYSALMPAPAGSPLVAFGDQGKILADTNGDGTLEETEFAYFDSRTNASRPMRFRVQIDRTQRTFSLWINGFSVLTDAPLRDDPNRVGFLQNLGWFSTLVNSGSVTELQQSTTGGGTFIIDDIRVYESNEITSVPDFMMY